MIESAALRKFVISYFLVHPTNSLCTVVNRISEKIRSEFFKGELVFIKKKELTGCVVQKTESGYIVEVYDDNQKVPQKEEIRSDELMRKDSASKNEVMLFLLSVTRETPLGRVVVGNAVQELGIFKGQKKPASSEHVAYAYKPEDSAPHAEQKGSWQGTTEEKMKEAKMIEKKRVEEQTSKILAIQREIWSAPLCEQKMNEKILAVYSMLYAFHDFFKIERFALDSFVKMLFSKDYTEKLSINIHTKLLRAISHERRKSGKDGLNELIQSAADTVYGNSEMESLYGLIKEEKEKESTGFTRVQWFAKEMASKSWKEYIKSFIYDIEGGCGVKIPTNEFATWKTAVEDEKERAADRVLVISLLIEICMLGIKFRTYFETEIEELRERERERVGLSFEVKRLRDEIGISEPEEGVKMALAKSEALLAELDLKYAPEIARSKIGSYGGVVFLMIGTELFYTVDETYYRIDKEHWSAVLSLLCVNKKKDVAFSDQLRKHMRA